MQLSCLLVWLRSAIFTIAHSDWKQSASLKNLIHYLQTEIRGRSVKPSGSTPPRSCFRANEKPANDPPEYFTPSDIISTIVPAQRLYNYLLPRRLCGLSRPGSEDGLCQIRGQIDGTSAGILSTRLWHQLSSCFDWHMLFQWCNTKGI